MKIQQAIEQETAQEITELKIKIDNYFNLIPGSSSHLKNKTKYYLEKGNKEFIKMVWAALATDNWKNVKLYLKELW